MLLSFYNLGGGRVDKDKELRELVKMIVAVTGVDSIDFAKLVIKLAYEKIDRIDKEDK